MVDTTQWPTVGWKIRKDLHPHRNRHTHTHTKHVRTPSYTLSRSSFCFLYSLFPLWCVSTCFLFFFCKWTSSLKKNIIKEKIVQEREERMSFFILKCNQVMNNPCRRNTNSEGERTKSLRGVLNTKKKPNVSLNFGIKITINKNALKEKKLFKKQLVWGTTF